MTAAERAALAALAADLDAQVQFDLPLAELTTWRIGGPASAVFQPRTREALLGAMAWAAQQRWPVHVLGNGSNLLAPDEGVPGLVLHLANHLADCSFDGEELAAAAGCFLPRLARDAAERGLSGLECVVGVPGTVGGACVTNAGIPSGTLGDVLVDVDVVRPDGSVITVAHADLALGHRESRLRHEPWTVLSARLHLRPDDREQIQARLTEHLAYRKRTQPLNLPSCGSVFRRPDEGYPGALIEAAGCKGLRRGGAEVSTLHANWIVNRGGATAADVRWLIETIQQRVRRHSGVELALEVLLWP